MIKLKYKIVTIVCDFHIYEVEASSADEAEELWREGKALEVSFIDGEEQLDGIVKLND
jgi:hypothetical protein